MGINLGSLFKKAAKKPQDTEKENINASASAEASADSGKDAKAPAAEDAKDTAKAAKEAQKKVVTESVIYLDTKNETFHLYTMTDGAKESLDCVVSDYKAKPFEKDFYAKLGEFLDGYRESHPDIPLQKVSVVLPDSVIITDTINVPTIGRRAMMKSINVVLTNIFKNSAELTFNQNQMATNSQFSTFAVVGTHKKIIARLNKLFTEHQVGIGNITYASSAAASGICALMPKLRTTSYVILDVKADYSRLIFVTKGKAIGFYTIPYGENVLDGTQLLPEDMLLDHSLAELIVLNAREKARAKALTLLEKPLDEYEEVVEDGEDDEKAADTEPMHKAKSPVLLAKKTPRKLPGYMLRPVPETEEGFVYENFRLILKQALGVIISNVPTTALGMPEYIYINLPEKYSYLYPTLADESEESGIGLTPLFTEPTPEVIIKNIEVFGGLYYKQYNKGNNLPLGPFAEFAKDGEEEKTE